MILRRRVYYEHGLRAIPIAGAYSRNIRPKFFADNESATHRLMPWLARELRVILGDDEKTVKPLYNQICTLIRTVGIENPEMRRRLEPALGANTDHFLHEFREFARSPYTMDQWDRLANYPPMPDNDDEVRELIPVSPPPEITINDDSPEVVDFRGENSRNRSNRRHLISLLQNMAGSSNDELNDSPRLGGSDLTPPELNSIEMRGIETKTKPKVTSVGSRMNEIAIDSDDDEDSQSDQSSDYYQRARSPSPVQKLLNNRKFIRNIWDEDESFAIFDTAGPSWRSPPTHRENSVETLQLPNSTPVKKSKVTQSPSPARSDELIVIAEMKPKRLRTPEVVDLLNDDEETSNSSSGPSNFGTAVQPLPVPPAHDDLSLLEKGERSKHHHKKHKKHRSKSRDRDGTAKKRRHDNHSSSDRHSRGKSSKSSKESKSKSSHHRHRHRSRESDRSHEHNRNHESDRNHESYPSRDRHRNHESNRSRESRNDGRGSLPNEKRFIRDGRRFEGDQVNLSD